MNSAPSTDRVGVDSALRLYRTPAGPVVELDGRSHQLPASDWDELINRDDLGAHLRRVAAPAPLVEGGQERVAATALAPIGTQEVWASGVTYATGRAARISEAEAEAEGTIALYRRIYHAERPMLFFKAPHYRVVGPGQDIRFRSDSTWTFPEAELTFFATSTGKIVAYTVGNDMSAGGLEMENPLYSPQAKIHDACAGLGPCLLVTKQPLPPETRIGISVRRGGLVVFSGETPWKIMTRHLTQIADFLFRETSFATGVFLMTGAGIVPPGDFSLQHGDHIAITIDGIGTLDNVATRRRDR